jgi:hypothetical protein
LIVEEDEGTGEEHHEHEHAIGHPSSRRGSTFSLPELPVRKASIISTLILQFKKDKIIFKL